MYCGLLLISFTILCVAARNLDLYQVLAPNAYSFKEEFIPVIRKTVQSQVHEASILGSVSSHVKTRSAV